MHLLASEPFDLRPSSFVIDIRGLALPSAAKTNKSHYQSKVFVCVSLISGCMQIILWMRSIRF